MVDRLQCNNTCSLPLKEHICHVWFHFGGSLKEFYDIRIFQKNTHFIEIIGDEDEDGFRIPLENNTLKESYLCNIYIDKLSDFATTVTRSSYVSCHVLDTTSTNKTLPRLTPPITVRFYQELPIALRCK